MTNQAIGRQTICVGKLIFLWSVYGYAMASLTAAVRAEDKPAAPAPDAMPAAEEHGPGLGEIMSLQQMRHIKLWFAGNAANWPLADYEIDKLKDGFDDLDKILGGETVSPFAHLLEARPDQFRQRDQGRGRLRFEDRRGVGQGDPLPGRVRLKGKLPILDRPGGI